jgi:hypothetical protein
MTTACGTLANRAGLLACCLAVLLVPVAAGAAQGSVTATPNFSGYWELRFDSFSVPRALLTPEAQAGEDARVRRDIEAIRSCAPMGMPALMSDRPVLNIQQSSTTIGMIPKGPASVRYIHIDGRGHPPADEWEGATNGHSIGRWEGDTLVVDTIGFNDRGLTVIPGGGWRTPESKLTERYRLLYNGLVLSVTFSWDDPRVFRLPHTYEFRYYKVQDIVEPRSHNCIGNDPERRKFLEAGGVLVR